MKRVLLVESYGIDVFYKMELEFLQLNCLVDVAKSYSEALQFTEAHSFDAILINVEPDGRGGIVGAEYLDLVSQSSLQQNSVCFGISTQTIEQLISADMEAYEQFAILVGCLNVPIIPEVACKRILELSDKSSYLTVAHRKSHNKNIRKFKVA